MKTYSIQWILALVASASAFASPPQTPDERRPPPVPPIIAIFDTDRDAVLSKEEIQSATEILTLLDRNGDGEITLDELRMPPEGGPPPPGRPVPPLVKALDIDADGSLSAAELESAPQSLRTLDRNGDGIISPEELHPPCLPPHDGPPPEENPEIE